MKYEYLFKEFDPKTDADDITAWLKRVGEEEWEAVNMATMVHQTGGDFIGGIAMPENSRAGYTFLMKRLKKG